MSTRHPTSAVDIHAHFVPTGYRDALAARGVTTPDGFPIPAWSADTHVATMDRLGIETSVLSLSSPGVVPFGSDALEWARRVNDEAAIIATEYPGRFRFFGTVPLPDVEAACVEARRVIDDLGAAGIVLLTQTNGVYLGDAVIEPLIEVLDELAAVVFVHPTSPAGCKAVDMGRPAAFVEYLVDSTRAFVNLYTHSVFTRYPHIRWIVAHNGALLPDLVDRVDLLAPLLLPPDPERGTLADALGSLYYEIGSSAPFPRAAASAAALTDFSHLLLGTDYPYAPLTAIEDNLAALQAGHLVQGAQLRALLMGNAQSILLNTAP